MATIHRTVDQLFEIRFDAMASPCSILLDCDDATFIQQCANIAEAEALRIEHAYSRYRNDNIVYQINTAQGAIVAVDDELSNLLDFAEQLFQFSNGLFDITSGVLRKLWRFTEHSSPPNQNEIDQLLSHVGWHRAIWKRPQLQLLPGMEIDLGGIGKEYAVDRVFDAISKRCNAALLINFGGDLRARGPKRNGDNWLVGIERPDCETQALTQIPLHSGALTTSGDSRRFFLHNGVRYGHILNPKTGYPVMGAPRSVTVMADTAIEAGALSTLAMLQGEQAESFLSEQNIKSWCIR